ncbi:MAG: SufE family protein [Emcibacteraceae bacterium]|jgi:cysteine desulfuration protein SufE|uniref:SufE family protein n=1 Tax=Pseudemcibacter sp. TaxID=2943293 RepID=UPI002324DE19|nr:SufE family protein [Kordiimonadaceae bacterium]MDA7568554.1 SufE family protein [Emcibacteraceae bacterium]MDA9553811.1 SufE family protein [Emcibacteraceae bacterium]MDG1019856.1 SufE family protein [Emcibacteraceae bacterium]MDG1727041.1 SufE family protein [Emcibacteraceae bacterium]
MNIEEVKETFEFMDEWEDRYRFIIDLGRKLPDFDEADQTEENRVHGCSSKVWLVYDREDDKILFKGDSDAHIVKGLVALILMIFSNKTPKEIVATDANGILNDLGLSQHLSPMRTNGLFSMVERIKSIGESFL